jgi:hypothetical protein
MSLPHVVTEPQVASDNMFEKPNRLGFNKLVNHITQHSADGVESFVCMANVRQTSLIEKNFLHNENGHGF